MLGPEETRAFFLQLLQGLLTSLQPEQQQEQEQVTESPLREACKNVLAAVCQLLGPEQFLQMVLQPVGGLTDHAASIEPKVLEVGAQCLGSCIQGVGLRFTDWIYIFGMVIRSLLLTCEGL